MQLIYPIVALGGLTLAALSAAKKSAFFNFLGILVAIYGGLKSWGLVMAPFPAQVITMYMAISVFAFLIYFSVRENTLEAFLNPGRVVLAEEGHKVLRAVVFILIPLLLAYIVYAKVKPGFEPPVSARIMHPEPPIAIDFRGQSIKILGLENPLRKDTANLAAYVEKGKEIYYQNCFFCHGDDLDGGGNFALAFNPLPPPFRGKDTIAQLPESYVFWRLAKGWTGLPQGSRPWDSAMPAFENFLTEEEIWKVILFIYDYSGNKPRTWE